MEMPFAGDALERVNAALLKFDARTRDQVFNCAGHPDLTRTGFGHHPRGDVDGDACDFLTDQFVFSGVQAHTNFNPQ